MFPSDSGAESVYPNSNSEKAAGTEEDEGKKGGGVNGEGEGEKEPRAALLALHHVADREMTSAGVEESRRLVASGKRLWGAGWHEVAGA